MPFSFTLDQVQQECQDARVTSVDLMGMENKTAFVDLVSFNGQTFDFADTRDHLVLGTVSQWRPAKYGRTTLTLARGVATVTRDGVTLTSFSVDPATAHLSVRDGRLSTFDEGGDNYEKKTGKTLQTSSVSGTWVLRDEGLVVLNEAGQPIWTNGDPAFQSAGTAPVTGLAVNASVHAGDQRLVMQGDGNLVIYGPGGPVFNTGTFTRGSTLIMQSDGNLVIYGPDGRWQWQSGTSGNPGATATLTPQGLKITSTSGTVLFSSATSPGIRNAPPVAAQPTSTPVTALNAGQSVTSPNGKHRLVMQGDGNLVVYNTATGRATWNSGTAGNPGARFAVQGDGNLVIYRANGTVAWNAGTHGNPGTRLVLQDDGNLVLYRANNTPLWWTRR